MDNNHVKKLTDHDILTILQGRECFTCRARKIEMRSFCPRCYYAVTPDTRQTLYRRFGEGYAQAFIAALNELGVEAEFIET